jgi:AraC family transcriptional activator of tynA and feaB
VFKLYSNTEVKDQQHTNHLYTLNTELFSVEVEPADRSRYRAHAETAALGALTLARITTNGAVVSRKNEQFLDPNFKRFSLMYVIEGDIVISHHIGTSTLKTGEFTLLDNSHPRKMLVYDHVKMFLISVPSQVLQRYIPVPEAVLGQTLQAGIDHADTLFQPLLRLWDPLKQGCLRDFAPSISDRFLGSVARVYNGHFPALGSTAVRRVTEAKQWVEASLANPDLSVESIATGMGVSSRYLRGLFHGTEKLSHYILRRRLEESASQLADIANQYVSITAIALRCGFNSPAHYSRAFRKHFGQTPRAWRKQQLTADATRKD